MAESSSRLNLNSAGLVVFDLYEAARSSIERRGVLEPVAQLVSTCRKAGLPVFFTRPVHRADGRDLARTLPDMDRDHRKYGSEHPHPVLPHVPAGDPGTFPLVEFGFTELDVDITKHRWSAFFQTSLDLTLRSLKIDTLLIVGGTTHIGVASTIYAARDLDYQVVVVRDGCHGTSPELECLLDNIFPQICHVRTLQEVLGYHPLDEQS